VTITNAYARNRVAGIEILRCREEIAESRGVCNPAMPRMVAVNLFRRYDYPSRFMRFWRATSRSLGESIAVQVPMSPE
jgi:hypothetical protein